MNTNEPLLMPRPKEMTLAGGWLDVSAGGSIALIGNDTDLLLASANKLKGGLRGDWAVTAGPPAGSSGITIVLRCDANAATHPQGYTLRVAADGVRIEAATPAGVYYGVCTLRQLLTNDLSRLPFVYVSDHPDFAVRGVMIDISRDKVPSFGTLTDLVELLSEWKINQVQLYTEHTFAYPSHEVVWKDASPMTGEEIRRLDQFCKDRYIELVPNQNSFGHMERWLKHDAYRHLAEAPDGSVLPWGGRMDYPFGLCPVNPGSIELIRSMYDELLPHFTSKLFNVGCDETYDLGQGGSKEACEQLGSGRVYLDFLLKIHAEVKRHGRTMMFWGDIMLHHPELIGELPKDIIALEWGYEAGHPFAADGQKFAELGVPFWVCPGTSSWNSLTGRTNNAIENLRNAAVNGLATGALGFLNTDWGDCGHLQYLPASYLGFLYGASASWNSSDTGVDQLKEALDLHAFRDSAGVMGGLAFDLGNSYEEITRKGANCTPIWQQIANPLSELAIVEGSTPEEYERVEALARRVLDSLKHARMDRPDADLVRDEYANMALMTVAACRLAIVRMDLASGSDASASKAAAGSVRQAVISEHERLWMARNRPGGFVDSRAHLDARLAEVSA